MRYPITPIRPEPGNKAITILRIFLWLMPAIFIPISVVVTGMFFDLIYGRNTHIVLGFCVLGLLIATAAVGYFDRLLDLMQKKVAPPHSKKDLARCTILFVLMQIIIAPVICYAALLGFCAVTGII